MKQPSVSKTGHCRIKSNNESQKSIHRSKDNFIEKSPSPILSVIPDDDSYVKKTLDNDERNHLLTAIVKNKVNIDCNFQKAMYWLDESKKPNDTKKGVKVLGKGSYGIVFAGCPDIRCDDKVAIKVVSVSKEYLSDKKHPVYVESAFLSESTRLYKDGITPNVTLLFFDFSCELSQRFFDLDSDNKKLLSWKSELEGNFTSDRIYNRLGVFVTELATTDLYQRLKLEPHLTEVEWKVVLFQAMHILVCFQYHLPGFRHNDYKPDNILLDVYEKNEGGVFVFKMFDKEYYVPDIGLRLKIWDFDFAGSHDIPNGRHDKEFFKKFGCNRDYNPVYDLHIFLNIILHHLPNSIHPNILPFFESIITPDIRGNDSKYTDFGRLTRYKETNDIDDTTYIPDSINTPASYLLFDDIFSEFRSEPTRDYRIVDYIDTKIEPFETIKHRKDMFK